jgi:hypothetical protein
MEPERSFANGYFNMPALIWIQSFGDGTKSPAGRSLRAAQLCMMRK